MVTKRPFSWLQVVFLWIFFGTHFCTTTGNAQTSKESEQASFQSMENILREQAFQIINGPEWSDRLQADSIFTRTLVRTLRGKNSFRYAFDSLGTVSVLYAPDSSFKIFSWQLMKDPSYFRYKAAIQYNTPDGSLRLTPLFDASPFTEQPCDSVRTANQWIGALYYNILQHTYQGRSYYTLLGYDENDELTTRKWIDVLTFYEQGQPLFGGLFFEYLPDDKKPPLPAYRFLFEYKKNAGARMNYDPDLQLITFASLVSEKGNPAVHATLVPEGGYEGFKWVNGKWVHVALVAELDPNPQINPPKETPASAKSLPVPPKKKGNTKQ
ncbi:MAG: hypothetical protein IM540_01925 [Chitinophagaceae bacterium]|nr:hypothetical protein [Chitinophagaceae bacterium]